MFNLYLDYQLPVWCWQVFFSFCRPALHPADCFVRQNLISENPVCQLLMLFSVLKQHCAESLCYAWPLKVSENFLYFKVLNLILRSMIHFEFIFKVRDVDIVPFSKIRKCNFPSTIFPTMCIFDSVAKISVVRTMYFWVFRPAPWPMRLFCAGMCFLSL